MPRTVAEGLTFLEGPRWHEGRLWMSDFFTGRVLAVDDEGRIEVIASLPGSMPSGLGWDTAGRLLVSSMVDRRLLRLTDGAFEEVADLSDLAPWFINDMLVDPAGNAYVGQFGWDDSQTPTITPTTLLLIRPGGEVSVAASGLVFPNGMALADEGRTLLVSETFAGRISAFTRSADGTLSERRVWAQFADREFGSITEALQSGVPLPDGLAIDAEGHVWMGDAAGRAAHRVSPGGEVVEQVEAGDGQSVFAVALGGADGRILYMCAAEPYGKGDPSRRSVARLLTERVTVPGVG
ncbi:MAG: SMP-30/gluconolactonase/LRE family protein [Actinomycetes bacterium]